MSGSRDTLLSSSAWGPSAVHYRPSRRWGLAEGRGVPFYGRSDHKTSWDADPRLEIFSLSPPNPEQLGARRAAAGG